MDLRANTAIDVLIGPFVDSTDGDTDETGLTLSQADITLSKNGQALAQKNDATAAAHDANGYYNCELDATDTNTEGNLVLRVHESGALNVRHEYNVLSEAAWDSLYAAKDTGFMDVNVKAVSEDTTAADNLESACDNYSVTRGLTGTALPAAVADAAGGLPISDAGGLDVDAKIGAMTYTTANQLDVNILAISSDTTAADNLELQYDTTGLTGDEFPATQAQIGNLTSGTAAINTTAESFTKVGAEPETYSYTDTHTLNGTLHIVEDDATATDGYYQFDVGGNGVPVSMTWDGYAQSNNDTYTIWAYNYSGTAYEQIGTLNATNSTTAITETFNLTIAHVGTGANIGKVRFRFLSSDGTAFATDRILCSYAIVAQSVGYANGAVWIDTAEGAAGTELYVNGVADNPVVGSVSTSMDYANTIAGNLNIHRFEVTPDSALTLDATQANDVFNGRGYILALGSQVLTGAHIIGGTVSGTATTGGDEMHFQDCEMGTCTLGASHLNNCGLTDTITLSQATTYTLQTCHSEIAGTGAPTIDFGAAIGNTSLNMRRYSGGIEVENMGQSGTDTMSLEGDGQLIVNANCTGGTIVYRGHFTITDNSGGAVTITSDDVVTNVVDILADTNELQTNQGNWLTATGFATETKQNAQDAIITEARLAELDAANIPADVDNILTDTASIGVTKNATFSNLEFLMVDETDHVTPETGLTVTGQMSIDGAAFAAVNGAIAEVSNGIYQIDLTADDTNGDVITYRFSSAGAADRFITIKTRA